MLLAQPIVSMKITITLNHEQEKYFHEVMYGLMDMDATKSDVINHILMEAMLFEEIMQDQITSFLSDRYPLNYKDAIETRDFGKKFKPQ